MNAVKSLLAAALALAAAQSFAAPTPLVLDFETAPPLDPVKVGSPYTGITFSPTAWVSAGRDVSAGAYGNFKGESGAINKGAVTLAADIYDPDAPPASSFTITVEKGFNGMFSLLFGGADGAVASISAYAENGDHLAQFDTSASSPSLCTGNVICDWTLLSMDLKDTKVFSIQVTGVDGKQWFDDFTFGNLLADDTGGNVPEPSGIALSLAALGGLAWTRRRSSSNKR